MTELNTSTKIAIKKNVLNDIISLLKKRGYETVGPKIKENTLACEPIETIDDLPYGYVSEQEKGTYRLKANANKRYFDIIPGQQSWKKFLFPPRTELLKSVRSNGNWKSELPEGPPPKYAFIGVRPCDLSAIGVQDKVFIRTDYTDPIYSSRRQNLLIISVNCLHPAATCFCTSMNTGPKAEGGFDLSLTELEEVFLVEIGSDAGLSLMQEVPWELASAYHLQAAQQGFAEARNRMGRKIEHLDSVPKMLLDNLDNELWKEVGNRCLSCTNCTQVCPTCFCWDTQDLTGLTAEITQRDRTWDSCFNPAYSAQAGGNTRPSSKARYRQWLTHKMSTWTTQFGTFGCVGCGRCIVWCPAQIDITEEINKFQEALA